MINLSKKLMQEDAFPHVFALMILQFTFSVVLNGILLRTCPHLYTSFASHDGVRVTREFVCRRVFPIAVTYVLSIAASNWAYYYSSVPFLQMMKEANIITVYTISVILGLERFDLVQAFILLNLVIATLLSVDGELHFSSYGAILQGIACLADATKNIMSSLLLSGSGRLDPMSFQCLISPMVVMLVGFGLLISKVSRSFASELGHSQMLALPPWQDFVNNRHLLMLNVIGAFVLNLSIAMFIRHSTALSFGILGIVKDLLVVLSSTILLGVPISTLQIFSFSAQIFFALMWTLLKLMLPNTAAVESKSQV